MNQNEIIQRIRAIELKTRSLTQHLFAGQTKSVFKARGMSFSEVRAYQFGDDVRTIDWNVTARFREPYVKIFEEERELTVMLLVDVSSSMYFGLNQASKIETAIEIAATIGFSAAKKNDQFGAIFFSNQIELVIPPKKGFSHVNLMLRKWLNLSNCQRKTSLGCGVEALLRLQKKRCVAILISDFLSDDEIKKDLKNAAKLHDLMAIQIYDQGELELPNIGIVQTHNAENSVRSWIDTSSFDVQQQYKSNHQDSLTETQLLFQSMNIDSMAIKAGDSVHEALTKLFQKRR